MKKDEQRLSSGEKYMMKSNVKDSGDVMKRR